MAQTRTLVLKAVYRINEEKAYSNLVVDKLLSRSDFDKRDRSLATHLIYGVIRWRNHLDWIINQAADRKVTKMTPWVRNALRLGVYQIKFSDSIPVPVACNETVEAAKTYCGRGAIKYLNGVLRNIGRNLGCTKFPALTKDPVQHIRYKYSFPQWLVERWVRDYGRDTTVKMCKSLNKIPITAVRTNTLRITRDQLLTNLKEEGVKAKELPFIQEAVKLIAYPAINKINSFTCGEFIVQGLSSMLTGHILQPEDDDIIVDLCSAPGGKTTHLAQLMDNQGQIYAVDIHQQKLDLVADNCKRLGIDNVELYCGDGREIAFSSSADKILVDAPCSGLGIIAKKPEIKWRKKPQDLKELQTLQEELLDNAVSLLKPGGEILYSVCTFTPEETKEVVNKVVQKTEDLSVVDLSPIAERYRLNQFVEDKFLKILPTSKLWEGFFMAKMKLE